MPPLSSLISHLHSKGLFKDVLPSRILKALGLKSSVYFDGSPQTVIAKEDTIDDLTGGVFLKDLSKDAYLNYVTSSLLVARELGLKPGEQALVANGRVSCSR
jgi:UDP-glucose:glycoprotein glucosyltransferase